jgi:hypothetical protein
MDQPTGSFSYSWQLSDKLQHGVRRVRHALQSLKTGQPTQKVFSV